MALSKGAGISSLVVAEVDSPCDQQAFETAANLTTVWVHRQRRTHASQPLLLERVKTLTLPGGDIHAWVACETGSAKELRAHLVG